MNLRSFCRMLMLLLCICSVCMGCICMEVSLDVIKDFAEKCCPGLIAKGNVRILSDVDPRNPLAPQIFDFNDQHIVKVTRENRAAGELNDDKKAVLALERGRREGILDNHAYKIIASTKYAIYKQGSGTFGEVKDVTDFSGEGEVSEGDYSILFMEKAKGVHFCDGYFEKFRQMIRPDEFGKKIAEFGVNFGKVCATMNRLGIEHKDLHFGNFLFDPITSVVTLIDLTLSGSTDCFRIMRDIFFPCIALSAIGEPISECICNFFYHRLEGMEKENLDYGSLAYYFVGSKTMSDSARDDCNGEDLLSHEDENILLSKIMKRIRPYLKKGKGLSFDEWNKTYNDYLYRAQAKRKSVTDLNIYLWILFVTKSDNKVESDKILSFILTSFDEPRKGWHKEMLDLMCTK